MVNRNSKITPMLIADHVDILILHITFDHYQSLKVICCDKITKKIAAAMNLDVMIGI